MNSLPLPTPEISIVMPCLNEADTLATCIEKAQRALREANIDGEIIVADNSSDDGSIEIAESLGPRMVPVAAKGYGSALMGAYNFLETPKFVEKLRAGNDLVQGCRLPSGSGQVLLMRGGSLFGGALVLGTVRVVGFAFDAHTLLYAALAILVGFQAATFALFTKMLAIGEGLLPEDAAVLRHFSRGAPGNWMPMRTRRN